MRKYVMMQRTVLRTSPDQGFKGINMMGWLIFSCYITYEILSMDQMETNLVPLFFWPDLLNQLLQLMGYEFMIKIQLNTSDFEK